jgi:hypothetical protein
MKISSKKKIIELCHSLLRNLAYYRSAWEDERSIYGGEPYRAFNMNCHYLVYLEWGKLFGSYNERHHWKNLVCEPDKFRRGLYDVLDCDEDAYKEYQGKMLTIRDKAIAHQDIYNRIEGVHLDKALLSTCYLIKYVHDHESDGIEILHGEDPQGEYNKYFLWGREFWTGTVPADQIHRRLRVRTVALGGGSDEY